MAPSVSSTPSVITRFTDQDAALFGRHTTRLPHRLHDHPLFTDEALADLIERLPRDHYNLNRMSRPDEPRAFWQEGELGTMRGRDVIEAIKAGQLWLNLRAVQDVDAGYKALLDDMFATFEAGVPGLSTFKRSFGILISSPRAQVFYHADVPGQGLWQVRGRKTIWIYPKGAPFLPQEALEGIVLGETEEEIAYQPWFDAHAERHDLEPGDGLLWDLNAPHRVENADVLNVSVTTVHWTSAIRRSYAVNYANGVLRRRLGVKAPSDSLRGFAVVPKMAFAAAYKKLGLHSKRQVKREIRFRLDAQDAPPLLQAAE
jgi:hypothetical protein